MVKASDFFGGDYLKAEHGPKTLRPVSHSDFSSRGAVAFHKPE